MLALFRHLLLSLALLCVQQGAVLHELSHHTAPQTEQEHNGKQHAAGGSCALCLAFSQVGQGASPSIDVPVLRADLAFHVRPAQVAQAQLVDLSTPRNRGPPDFF